MCYKSCEFNLHGILNYCGTVPDGSCVQCNGYGHQKRIVYKQRVPQISKSYSKKRISGFRHQQHTHHVCIYVRVSRTDFFSNLAILELSIYGSY